MPKQLTIASQTYNDIELQSLAQEYLNQSNLADHLRHFWQFVSDWLNPNIDYIEQQTSGSTGKPKIIRLPKASMRNSAQRTIDHFKLKEKNTALLCLSPQFVGGKMMIVRSFVAGLNLHIVQPSNRIGEHLETTQSFDFCAMVPTQVYELVNAQKTQHFKSIIIGGAPMNPSFVPKLQECSTAFYATYGMTETSSHIALKKLNGTDQAKHYQVLPNIEVSLDERQCLCINAPDLWSKSIQTNDMVELIGERQFTYLGRYDNVVNSGGIKIHPEKVEAVLAKILPFECFVTGKINEQLGEQLVLLIETQNEEWLSHQKEKLQEAMKDKLGYKAPKQIIFVESFPKTTNGKIDRKALKTIVS